MTFFENRRHLDEGEPSSEERCSGNLQRHLFAPARSARPEPRRLAVGDEVLNNARPVINHGIKSGIGLAGWGTQMQGYEPTRSVAHRRTWLPGVRQGDVAEI